MITALLVGLLAVTARAEPGRCWRQVSPPTVFENDLYGTLKNYLNRARATLAQDPPSLAGFGVLADTEAAKIPGTLKNEGLAFDGDAPIFSWRYGLQRADAAYRPTFTFPLAIPPDIQQEHYDPKKKNGFSHKRKCLYEAALVTGRARELAHFDEPDRAEAEGLAFGPDGTLHVFVLAPYFYDARFPPEMEINDDDWNPSAKLLHFRPGACRKP